MKKKIIIILIVLVVLAGSITGGVYAYKSYQSNNLLAEVQSVANLNWGYYGDSMESYGTVTNDMSQDIYLDAEQTVSEVYVEEGQQVSVGDKLLAYDITSLELQLEMKKLDVQSTQNDITIAQKELETLKNTVPIPDTPVVTEPEPEPEPEPETESETEVPEKTDGAYNYISDKAKAYAGDGEKEPLTFLCTQQAVVYGSYLNYLKENSYTAIFEIREGNKKKGTLISSWTVNGAAMEKVDDASEWSVLDRQEVAEEPETETEPEIEEPVVEEPEVIEPEGYTAAELAKEITKKQNELKDLDLAKRTGELEVTQLEKQLEDGTVYATINGIVKTVQDPENLPSDGSAFLSVAGSDGLYVSGQLSEMVLDKVKVGQMVTATSWESNTTVTATITSISDYPIDSSSYYGEGNPNSSYYAYTAYIEDATGLTNGESVSLSMDVASAESGTGIYLEKGYVRDENGKSYVYKAGEDDRLVKQYVTTGMTVYGQAVEITSGLTETDRIAFPYGKTAKEGVKVTGEDSSDIAY